MFIYFKTIEDAIYWQKARQWGYTPDGVVFPRVECTRSDNVLKIKSNINVIDHITNYKWFKVEN